MELIIKPVMLCNFKCTFCSSTEIAESNTQTLPHEYIFRFLKRFPETNSIIINGGDPLMVLPEYYWKIIAHLDEHKYPARLSFTTNLWDYYKKPNKWIPLFKHPRVGIATSFQYGEGRRITKTQILTEEIFIHIVKKFEKDIGYIPEFIAVISEENEDTVIKTVELAKRLGVVCKLNYANASGRQLSPYPVSKMYEKYIEIYEKGLAEWEYSTKQMFVALTEKHTTCPLSRDCDQHIRALNPDGGYYSCGSLADDREFGIDFNEEMKSANKITPLSNSKFLFSLKEECHGCPMFKICNGCRKSIFDLKRTDMVEDHCVRMKKLAPKILKYMEEGWK